MSADPKLLFVMFSGDGRIIPAEMAELLPPLPENASAEQVANPDLPLWPDGETYLAEQKARLPWSRYRRLHLNLSGGPEGAAFATEAVDRATDKGTPFRPPKDGIRYFMACDLSGGSVDDCGFAVGHWEEPTGLVIVDKVGTQLMPAPFDPLLAASQFVEVARQYRVKHVTGDAFAGDLFAHYFRSLGLSYVKSATSASDLYEGFEPLLNAAKVRLPDVPKLREQLVSLVWKGQKITHPSDGHDDVAVCVAGLAVTLADPARRTPRVRSYLGRLG